MQIMITILGGLAVVNLFLLPICTYSYIDPQYQACKPFECGHLNISYPFYVPPTQPSYCGLGGYNVSCNNRSQTIIRVSGDNYIIDQIYYDNLTIHVTNSAFSTSVFSCSASIHSLILGFDGRLNFTSEHRDIYLFPNSSCRRNIKGRSKNYTEIKCGDDNEHPNLLLLAVYGEEFNVAEFGECGDKVLVPYYEDEITKSSSSSRYGSSIEGILRRGITLDYTANNCTRCLDTKGRCGFNTTTKEIMCFCPIMPHRSACYAEMAGVGYPRLMIFSGAILIILITAIILIIWRRRQIRPIRGSSTFHTATEFKWDNKNFNTILDNYATNLPQRYSYSEIKKMTNSFAERIGEGGYGAVYKGKLLDGRLVAVKLLKNTKGDGEGFMNEVLSIGRTNHVNIVTLLGFCTKGDKRALVYEFMENGSLEKYINGKTNNGQSLSLEKLFQIMLGIARGLEYLHRGCKTRILHFDIKPHNILLDNEFIPKISDFGLAKLAPQNKQSKVSMSGARGTIGYIAPEVFCRTFGDVSHKSDVYSYGMMVLEVIGSRENTNTQVDSSSEMYFPHWIYKQLEHEEEEEVEFDITMNGNDKELKRKMIIVSLWCIQPVPSSRPSMSGVVKMLEGNVEAIEIPPMPSHSSPPRPELDSSWSSTMTS